MVAPDRPDTQRGAERLQGSEQGSRIPLGTAVNEIARQQHHVRSLLHRTADPVADVMLVQERAVMQVAQLDGPERRHEPRSEEHTSELQSRGHLVCRLLLEKKKFL